MHYEFIINGVPYHFDLIPSASSQRKLDKLHDSSEYVPSSLSKGRALYTVGNSNIIHTGSFRSLWTDENFEASINNLDIYFSGRKISLESTCYDNGTGEDHVSIKRKGHKAPKIEIIRSASF